MKQEYELVRFDWAIKRLLRDKANFDVLEGFLSVVLNDKVKIEEILESESNKQTADDKFNRVDIKAKNSKDEIIIVEVQNTREVDYLLRILYGVAKTVTEHISTGKAYSNITKVYSISILYFNLGTGDDYVYRGQTEFKGIHTNTALQLTVKERKLMGFMEPREVFPEYYLMMVADFDKVAVTPLEEWISYLKTGKIREDAEAPGLQEAREKLRVIAMSKEEQNAYETYLHDVASFMLTQKVEKEFAHQEGLEEGKAIGIERGKAIGIEQGKAIGIEQGKAIGIEQGKAIGIEQGKAIGMEQGKAIGIEQGKTLGKEERDNEIALKMIALGMPSDVISQTTGLSVEDIDKMR